MAFETIRFADIDVSDLQGLVDNNISESRTLEYKATMYERGDLGNREALKDITAFANADGGHLILGISEKNGTLAFADRIKTDSVGKEIERLEAVLRNAVEPRLVGCQIKAVNISADAAAIVIHVPRSWTKPHRTNSKHFYVRNSNGVHDASVNELRTLFLSSQMERERIRDFIEDRVGALATENGIVPLKATNLAAIHMIPILSFLGNDPIDLKRLKENPEIFPLINLDMRRGRPNLEGFCIFSHSENGKCEGYTQIFRNGAIEAVLSGIVRDSPDGGRGIPRWIIKKLVASIAQYEEALVASGRKHPFAVFVSLLGAKGAYLWFGTDPYDKTLPSPVDREIFTLPESLLDQPESEERKALRLKGTLDALWNAGGEIECTYFDEKGAWHLP